MDAESGKLTILVVDDTPENIDVLDGLLSDEYKIKIAVNGEKALKIAGASPQPDLILLDIMMPGMDGYEVCENLKANPATKNIPIIFLTAKTEVEDETKGFQLGAVDYITKPISPPIVKERVKTHLALKIAREKLEEQNEELRDAAILREDIERMSRHDLKSPINSVIAMPDFVLDSDNLTDDQIESLEAIKDAGYQMLHMVNLSMDLFKMEKGGYNLHPVRVDVFRLAKKILYGSQSILEAKNLATKFTIEGKQANKDDSVYVGGDELLCYSLFSNLIKNALEASPNGAEVTIDFGGSEPIDITISNKGMVPEKIQDRFFEKYATSGKDKGTGLGTYSAMLIAKTHGGDISMTTSEEDGTSLIISMPPPPIERVRKPDQASTKSLKDMTFLIVDDLKSIRQIVKNTISRMGCKSFVISSDGQQAMEELEVAEVDFIISDWNMPKVSGFELLKWVRENSRLKNTPFLMVTAEATKEQILEAMQIGVSGYVVKPFTPQTLEDKIKDLLS